MKRLISIFIMIVFACLIYSDDAAGVGYVRDLLRRMPDDSTVFFVGHTGTDSLFASPGDTVLVWLRNEGFIDIVAIIDSLTYLESRTITRNDSLSDALRDTVLNKNDSLGSYYQIVIGDSTSAM